MITKKSKKSGKLQITIPITKIDEAQRLVYGVAAVEQVDKSKEILDYESSKPYFEKWSADIAKATKGKSVGNVREMHENSAVGKLTEFLPNDSEKQFEVVAKIIDDQAWEKVAEGVYTGFSIGGEYQRRWEDPEHENVKRYTAIPSEISLVDNPCIPDATFEYIKSTGEGEMRKFAPKMSESDVLRVATAVAQKLTKAVTQELVKKSKTISGQILSASDFAFVGDPQDTETWKLPIHDESHVKNALSRFNQTEGLGDKKAAVARTLVTAAKKYGIDTKGFEEEYVKSVIPNLKKGLYDVSRLAMLLLDLDCIQQCLENEAEWEQDGSPIPQKLSDQINSLSSILIELVTEETSELVGSTEAATEPNGEAEKAVSTTELAKDMNKTEKKTDLQKAVKPHLKEMSKAVDGLRAEHTKMKEHLDGMGAGDGSDEAQKSAKSSLSDMGKHADGIAKCHKAMGDHLDKLDAHDSSEDHDGTDDASSDSKGDDSKGEEAAADKAASAEFTKMEDSINELKELVGVIANGLGNVIKSINGDSSVQKTYSAVAINGLGVDAVLNSGQTATVTKEQDVTPTEKKSEVKKVSTIDENGNHADTQELMKMLKKIHQDGGTPVEKLRQ